MASNKTAALILMAALVTFCISETGAQTSCKTTYTCTYSEGHRTCTGVWWCTSIYIMKYKMCSKCCEGHSGPECT